MKRRDFLKALAAYAPAIVGIPVIASEIEGGPSPEINDDHAHSSPIVWADDEGVVHAAYFKDGEVTVFRRLHPEGWSREKQLRV